jgi:predicted transcriptional regulator of viral defense system
MSRKLEVSVRLADLAAGQWGLFTTSQARREGMSAQALARLAEMGHLERLRHGVYRIRGTPPGRWSNLQAAWLALQPDLGVAERHSLPSVEVVSHRSAAQIHKIGDLDADRLEFLTPERRQARDRDVRLRRGVVAPEDRTVVEGLPVTTPLRTIVDLAAARLDGDHLAGVVRDAVTTLHLDPDLVAQALRPYAHRYGAPLGDGRGLLTDLLQRVGVPKATRTAAELWSAPLPQHVQAALDDAMRPFTAQLAALTETMRPFTARQAALAGAGETGAAVHPSDQKQSDRARRPGAGGHASSSEGPNRDTRA